jgi:hypothetical protein
VPPPLGPPSEIEVNPAWLEAPEPPVIVSEVPSSVSFADAVRVMVGPDGEIEVVTTLGAPRGYVEAVLVSTVPGARLGERLARGRGGKGKPRV